MDVTPNQVRGDEPSTGGLSSEQRRSTGLEDQRDLKDVAVLGGDHPLAIAKAIAEQKERMGTKTDTGTPADRRFEPQGS